MTANAKTTPATEPHYKRFRDDDWPYCPGCDEDELWSAATEPSIETIVSCLNCDWRPGFPRRVPTKEGEVSDG